MKIEKFSFGMGDRFYHQGKAQLQALVNARDAGIDVSPVWNKSDREHVIVGTEPQSLREEADAAVAALGWKGSYYVDADHINLATVDRFLQCSDFFTLDVADDIGEMADAGDIVAFVDKHSRFIGTLEIPGAGEYEVTSATPRGRRRHVPEGRRKPPAAIYRHIIEASVARISFPKSRWTRP